MTLPYITISGTRHELDGDEDGYFFASGVIPTCDCGEPLVDGEAPRPTVQSRWHDDHDVTCDFCGKAYHVEGDR